MTDSLPTSLQDHVAGSFAKTALLQKRVRELIKGASPLIETREKNPIKVAFLEMQQGLIELAPEEDAGSSNHEVVDPLGDSMHGDAILEAPPLGAEGMPTIKDPLAGDSGELPAAGAPAPAL